MTPLHHYADIHTHRLDAGPDAVINLPLGGQVPTQGSYSVGIHPWEAAEADADAMAWLSAAAESSQVVAIGEAGLDALRGPALDVQERVLRQQVELSERVGKPLILHAVRTFNRLIEIRRELKPTQEWIIHGFRGKPQLAQQLVRAGFSISLGERFNPAVPAVVPPSRLYRETDAM